MLDYYKTYNLETRLLLVVISSLFLPFFISGSVMVSVTIYLFKSKQNRNVIKNSGIDRLLYIIALYNIVISIINLNILGVLAGVYLLFLFTFFIIIKTKMTKQLIEDIGDLCCGLSYISCFIAIVQLHVFGTSDPEWRADSTFFNPNYYAYLIGFFCLFALYKAVTGKQKRDFYFLTFIINVFALYLCDTRSTIVVLAGGILVVLLSLRRYKYFGFASLICVAGVSLVTKYPQIIPRYEDLGFALMKRLRIVEAGFYAFLDKPIFGRGIYSYMSIFGEYDGAQSMHLHNLYLDTLLNFGIVGTIIIAIYLAFCFKKVYNYYLEGKTMRPFILLVGILSEILIHGFTDIPFLGIETSILTIVFCSILGIAENNNSNHKIKSGVG